jgi:hypothetical protein
MENKFKELVLIDLVVMQNAESITSKSIYEPIKPKSLQVAEKRCLYTVSDKKYSLDEYSEHQRENWAKSDIIIYENGTQLRNFIRQAKEGEIINEKIYFGKISSVLAEKIKNETGIDIEGYNLAISAHGIRKVLKSHGDEATEKPRGQRAITEDDIANIPQIILNPDKIILDDEFYRGRPVIKFIKTINGRTTVVSYASKKSKDLRVQTMYSGKESGALATVTDA